MKLWAGGLLVICSGLAFCAADLQAGEFFKRNPTRNQYPPRYTRASMSQTYVFKNRQGQPVKTVQSYPGYGQHFPPPAYLFYGYPHSGDFTGMGMDGSP
jgi:hypothetical protein